MTDDTIDITFAKFGKPQKGLVALTVGQGPKYSEEAIELDRASDGLIMRACEISAFEGKPKTFVDVLAPNGLEEVERVVLVGAGPISDYAEEDWLKLGGNLWAQLSKPGVKQATIIVQGSEKDEPITPEAVADLALGLMLRRYKFDKYKTKASSDDEKKNNAKTLSHIVIQCDEPAATRKIFNKVKAIANGVNLARDLVNEPANLLGPVEFAKRAKALEKVGLDVEILDEKALRKLKMNALLSVGQGSARPSQVAMMHWQGARSKKAKPIIFIGKGVCFDTGGISLKPSQGMEDMKGDMGGAACVTGLMQVLAARKAKINAVGIIGLVENMPGAAAQRPGDIVTSMSGQTIEVINTDAEGRLVLADLLWYARDRFKPQLMINLATLTGAIIIALGKEHAGLFSNDDTLCDQLTEAGQVTGEKVWRLPLGPKYNDMLKSKFADMKNVGGREAGSITAAQFLQRYVNDTPWAHIDIAGTGMAAPKTEINQSWGSGFGVRLLDRLVADYYEG